MNLGHIGDVMGRSQLTGWRSIAVGVAFSGSLVFDELFEIAHPPYVAWQPFVPSQLHWMQSVPAWLYLVSLTIGTVSVTIAFLTAHRRHVTLTVYRRISRLYRRHFMSTALPPWLFS